MEDRMISICGLVCSECPAYVATQANDEQKAAEIAAEWSKAYNANVTVDNVWCDSCLGEGRKCAHCAECEIRACGMERGVVNCAHCDEYPCEQLTAFFKMAPMARDTLDEVRAGL